MSQPSAVSDKPVYVQAEEKLAKARDLPPDAKLVALIEIATLLDQIQAPLPSKKLSADDYGSSIQVIDAAIEAIPTDSIELADLVLAKFHEWAPVSTRKSTGNSSIDWKRTHEEWVQDTTQSRTKLVARKFPSGMLKHMQTCADCGTFQVFQSLVTAPENKSADFCEAAIRFLKKKFIDTAGKRRTESASWNNYVAGLEALIPKERFASVYFEHVAGCAEQCGSWNVFEAVVTKTEMSVAGIECAFKALESSFGAAQLPKLRTISKLAKPVLTYIGCRLLATQISRQPSEDDRERLMGILINTAAGLGINRSGRRDDKWPRENLSGVLKPLVFRDSHPLKKYADDILLQVERRTRYFFWLCAAVYKDGCIYRPQKALFLYGSKELAEGHQRCHAAVIPLVDRKKGENAIWDLGSGGLFHEYAFLHKMNRTVNLPTACNQVDSWIESTHDLRTKITPVLNKVAQGNMTPTKGGAFFLGALITALRAYIQQSKANRLAPKEEYGRVLGDSEDGSTVQTENGDPLPWLETDSIANEYAQFNLHLCGKLFDPSNKQKALHPVFLTSLMDSDEAGKPWPERFKALQQKLLADRVKDDD